MATNPTKLYVVNGILVKGTLSEGGSFYDIEVVQTRAKMRILAEIFERFSKPKEVKDEAQERERSPQA